MELVFTLILFIIIIIVIVNQKKGIIEESEKLRNDIRDLREEISRLNITSHKTQKEEPVKNVSKPSVDLYTKPLSETLYVVTEKEVQPKEVEMQRPDIEPVTVKPAAEEKPLAVKQPEPLSSQAFTQAPP